MKRQIFLIITLILTAVTAFGQMGNRGGKGLRAGYDDGFGPGFSKECRILRLDNLTDSQKDQFGEIRYNHQLQALEIRNDIAKNRLELGKIRRSDNPDKNAILNLIEKNGELKTKLHKSRVEMMFEMESLLTKEQLEQWKEMRQNFNFGERFGRSERNFKGYRHDNPRHHRGFDCWRRF